MRRLEIRARAACVARVVAQEALTKAEEEAQERVAAAVQEAEATVSAAQRELESKSTVETSARRELADAQQQSS